MEPVCGHNGETYTNLCSAYSDRVAVDYYGRCQDVGILSEHSFHSECASIKCPTKPTVGCKAVIPPGACCPLCAGVLRIIYDKEKLDRFAEATRKWPISILDILQKIRLQISVPQCDVFGYFSVESEIIVLVMPVDNQTKPIQIDACNKEAEKINSLINSDSPTLASQVPLSALITSEVQTSPTLSSNCNKIKCNMYYLCIYILLTLLYALCSV